MSVVPAGTSHLGRSVILPKRRGTARGMEYGYDMEREHDVIKQNAVWATHGSNVSFYFMVNSRCVYTSNSSYSHPSGVLFCLIGEATLDLWHTVCDIVILRFRVSTMVL
jgi:hypothetical protein